MATIFTDDFNSYNDGDLNGQGDWAGAVQYDVQGTIVKEGAKAVIGNSGGDYVIQKTGTAQTDGKTTFYVKTINHAGFGTGQYCCFRGLRTSPLAFWDIRFQQDGYITRYVNTALVNIQTYVDDHWYCVEVEWRSSPDYKYRVRIDGGTWTDWGYGYNSVSWTAGLNIIFADAWMTAGSLYFDYIAEEPISAAAGRSLGYIIG